MTNSKAQRQRRKTQPGAWQGSSLAASYSQGKQSPARHGCLAGDRGGKGQLLHRVVGMGTVPQRDQIGRSLADVFTVADGAAEGVAGIQSTLQIGIEAVLHVEGTLQVNTRSVGAQPLDLDRPPEAVEEEDRVARFFDHQFDAALIQAGAVSQVTGKLAGLLVLPPRVLGRIAVPVLVDVFDSYTCAGVYWARRRLMGKTHMYRAQILLEQQQHEMLAKIARREKRSISDVVREILDEWLAAQTLESQKRLELDALEQLGQIRLRIQEQRGVYHGDLLAEARSEREQDIERVWNGQP